MKRWILGIVVLVIFLCSKADSAIVFESQQREVKLVARVGSTECVAKWSSPGFGPFLAGDVICATGTGSELVGQAISRGSVHSSIEPGSITLSGRFSLGGGSGLGPDQNIYTSYDDFFNLVFSVTDSPLEIVAFNFGYNRQPFCLFNTNTGEPIQIPGINQSERITLLPGRYRLSERMFDVIDCCWGEIGYGDDDIYGLSLTYDAETYFVPEPSTVIIWSLLGGIGLVFGWRRRKTA